jgi:hypothetical protein
MKTLLQSILVLTAAVAVSHAQGWEVGASGGASFLNHVSVTGGPSSATAGFQAGVVAGGYVGFTQYKHIGGELHYTFFQSNLRLASGGTDSTFSGVAHAVHYDLIFKTAKNDSKVQFFGALGGGLKVFSGPGKEAPYIPLTDKYGYFTRATQVKAMASVGGGVKYYFSKKVFLRAEVRDFITPFPEKIIAPPPGVKYGSLLHDIVPLVTIGFEM